MLEKQHLPSEYIIRAHSARAGRTMQGNFVIDLIRENERLVVPRAVALELSVQTISYLLCQSLDDQPHTYDSRVRKSIRRLGLTPDAKPPSSPS